MIDPIRWAAGHLAARLSFVRTRVIRRIGQCACDALDTPLSGDCRTGHNITHEILNQYGINAAYSLALTWTAVIAQTTGAAEGTEDHHDTRLIFVRWCGQVTRRSGGERPPAAHRPVQGAAPRPEPPRTAPSGAVAHVRDGSRLPSQRTPDVITAPAVQLNLFTDDPKTARKADGLMCLRHTVPQAMGMVVWLAAWAAGDRSGFDLTGNWVCMIRLEGLRFERRVGGNGGPAVHVIRDSVLRYPDLAAKLCEPPLDFGRPEQWNGFIPPDTVGNALNLSPRRNALVALAEEAARRDREGRPPEPRRTEPPTEENRT